MNNLYILSVNPLSEQPLADSFVHSVGCLLILLIFSHNIQYTHTHICNPISQFLFLFLVIFAVLSLSQFL